MKNLLDDVKNGQWFCMKSNPKKIYKRIYDRVRQFEDDGFFYGPQTVVVVKSLQTGKTQDVAYPGLVEVIPLGNE
jgi:hypothetical protein